MDDAKFGAPVIEEAEIHVREVHTVKLVAWFEAQPLAPKCTPDGDQRPVPTDASTLGQLAHDETLRILWPPQPTRVRAVRCLVHRGRRDVPKRSVRPHVVVLRTKAVKGSLLRAEVACRWTQRFLFQSPMHAFVAPVLLGMSRSDALVPNAELDPPHGEARKAACTSARERAAVVRPNTLGQPSVPA